MTRPATWETNDDEVATVLGNTADEDINTGNSAIVSGVSAGLATITGRWGRSITGTASLAVTE